MRSIEDPDKILANSNRLIEEARKATQPTEAGEAALKALDEGNLETAEPEKTDPDPVDEPLDPEAEKILKKLQEEGDIPNVSLEIKRTGVVLSAEEIALQGFKEQQN